MDFANPQATLELLDALAQHNMQEEHFRRLHHLGDVSNNLHLRGIKGHRKYCLERLRFLPGGGNAGTAERLLICLQRLQLGDSWEAAISRAIAAAPFFGPRAYPPTSNDDELEQAVSALAKQDPPPEPPDGQSVPRVVETSPGKRFERDPNVVAWVEQRANGSCEHCRAAAPFQRPDGRPFLEISPRDTACGWRF